MNKLKGKLIITRHHESIWNKLGNWTGRRDVDLTPHGLAESFRMGEALRGMKIDRAISSELIRSINTMRAILEAMGLADLKIEKSAAINERDYGDYTGKYKWDIKEEKGEEVFNNIRRAWDYPVPKGETLKMVYNRVLPYYLDYLLPLLEAGENILLVAHTNSLRALIKYIEEISDEGIKLVEMPFGVIMTYQVNEVGRMVDKEVIKIE